MTTTGVAAVLPDATSCSSVREIGLCSGPVIVR
jgi:hypothetical protein